MAKIRINVAEAFDPNDEYYVLMDPGFVVSETTGDASLGLTDPNAFRMRTRPPVQLKSTTPPNTRVDFTFRDISPTFRIDVTFNEDVFEGTGFIHLYKEVDPSDESIPDELIQSFDVFTDVEFNFSGTLIDGSSDQKGRTITLYTTNELDKNNSYYLIVDEGALVDKDCFIIEETTKYDQPFTTVYDWQNVIEPTPEVTEGRTFELIFCEEIIPWHGYVRIYQENVTNELIEEFDITDGTVFSVWDEEENAWLRKGLRFTARYRFEPGETYYVNVEAGALIDEQPAVEHLNKVIAGKSYKVGTVDTGAGADITPATWYEITGLGDGTKYPTTGEWFVAQINGWDTTQKILDTYIGSVKSRTGFKSKASSSSTGDFDLTVYYPEVTGTLIVQFDRNVSRGTGFISLYNAADGSLVDQFDISVTGPPPGVTDPNFKVPVTLSRQRIKFDVTLHPGWEYYILIDNTAIVDRDGIGFAGISDPTAFTFTVRMHTPVTFIPSGLDQTFKDVRIDGEDNLIKHYSEDITLHKAIDDSVIYTFVPSDINIDVNGDVVFTNQPILESYTDYYFNVGKETFKDEFNYMVQPVNDNTIWSFKTAVGSTINTSTPLDNAIDDDTIDYSLTFNDLIINSDITKNFYLKDYNTDAVIETFNIGTDITISNTDISFSRTTTLTNNTHYYIDSDAQTLDFDTNVLFGGIQKDQWDFTTQDLVPVNVYPNNGSLSNGIYINDFKIEYSKPVTANTGNFVIKETISGNVFTTIAITDPKVTITDNWVVIDTSDLTFTESLSYTVTLDYDALRSNNIIIKGIADTEWVIETAPPVVFVEYRENRVKDVITPEIVYDEPIQANAGYIKLYRKSDLTLLDQWEIGTLSITTESGTNYGIINLPSITLDYNDVSSTDYYFTIDDNTITSVSVGAGNNQISDSTTLLTTIPKGPALDLIIPADKVITGLSTIISLDFDEAMKDYSTVDIQIKRVEDNLTYTVPYNLKVGDNSVIEFNPSYDKNDGGKTFEVILPDDCATSVATDLDYKDAKTTPIVFTSVPVAKVINYVNNDTSLVITFDGPVNVVDNGADSSHFVLKALDAYGNIYWQSFTSSEVLGSGTDTITINYKDLLVENTNYEFIFSNDALIDVNSVYAVNSETLTFTSQSSGIAINNLSPANGAIEVDPYSNLIITFNAPITKGFNNIILYRSTGVEIERFTVDDVIFGIDSITINPTERLPAYENQSVYVVIESGFFSYNNYYYKGFNDDTVWKFSVEVVDISISCSYNDQLTHTTTVTSSSNFKIYKPATQETIFVTSGSITFDWTIGFFIQEYDEYTKINDLKITGAVEDVTFQKSKGLLNLTQFAKNNTEIKTVTIENDFDSVTSLYEAFMNSSLTSFTNNGIITCPMQWTFADCSNLTTIDFGDTSQVTTMERVLSSCSALTNLIMNFNSTEQCTNLNNAWNGCTSLTSFPLINTVNCTQVVGTWGSCTGLTSFPAINTINVTNYSQAWSNCTGLTGFPSIDTINGTDFESSWSGCTGLTSFPELNLSNGLNFDNAWSNCTGLTSFPGVDVNKGTSFIGTWQDCSNLTDFPSANISMVSATTVNKAWDGCSSLTSFPTLLLGNVTDFSLAWNGCSSLTSFPAIDTSSATTLYYAWNNCSSLIDFSSIDTSNVTDFRFAWKNCSNLISFPFINTSAGILFDEMWSECSNLTCINAVNTLNATSTTNMFLNCTSLLNPDASTQTQIEAGLEWVNNAECPAKLIGTFDLITSGDTITVQVFGTGYIDGVYFSGTDELTFATSGQTIEIKSFDITSIKFKTNNINSISITDASNFNSLDEMCWNLDKLTSVSIKKAFNVISARFAWSNCWALSNFELEGTSKLEILEDTWSNCVGFESFPLIDTSAVTNFHNAWMNCNKLLTFPGIDTSNGVDFGNMFRDCTSLGCLTRIDTTNATNTSDMFLNCSSLTAPNATDQTAIEGGTVWVNPDPCQSNMLLDMISDNGELFKFTIGGGAYIDGTLYEDGTYTYTTTQKRVTLLEYDANPITSFKILNDNVESIIIEKMPRQLTTLESMCSGLTKLTSFRSFDSFTNITNLRHAWQGCTSLSNIEISGTDNVTDFLQAWYNCTSLIEMPIISIASAVSTWALSNTWFNCSSLTSFPALDTSNVTSLSGTWRGCSGLTSFPSINTSNVTNYFDTTWAYCSSLTSFPLLDTSSVTSFINAWQGCSNLTSFPAIDTSSATSLQGTWSGCTGLTSFPDIITSNVTDFRYTWRNCSSITSVPNIDTSSGTEFTLTWENWSVSSFPQIDTSNAIDMYGTWQGCSNLTSFPDIITTNVTRFENTWKDCSSLTSFPLLDTSSGTNIKSAWSGCSSLTSFPAIDTSNATSLHLTWSDCSSLTSFPSINTSLVTSCYYAWFNCSSLTSFPLLDTSAVTNFDSAWSGCTGLTSFPAIDTTSGTTMQYTWNNCSSLTSFPLLDTSNVTTFNHTWTNCSSISGSINIDVSSGTNFDTTFSGCTELTHMPALNTVNGTYFAYMFQNCTNLICLTSINTLNDTSDSYIPGMFENCTSLVAPSLTEQSEIRLGANWTNPGSCP